MIPCFQEYLHAHIHEQRCVAVLADDDEYDYYLMNVSKVPFQLEHVENDDWGNTFPVGANVVRGYYYNRRKQNPFKYELVRRRVAIVYSVAKFATERILREIT
jgi:hypothetical protein